MQIFKDKKLFGILNLLDIAIIGAILAFLLPGIGYFVKYNERGMVEKKVFERYLGRKDGSAAFKCEGTIDVNVSFKNLTEGSAALIKTGDKETLPDGTVLAEIIGVGARVPNYFIVKSFGPYMSAVPPLHMLTNDGLYTVPAKLRLRGTVVSKIFYYKTGEVSPDSVFSFDAGIYKVWGEVESFSYQ